MPDPEDITGVDVAWVASDLYDAPTSLVNDDRIESWFDRGGVFEFTASGPPRPTFDDTTGAAAARFDSANDRLSCADPVSTRTSGSVFVVMDYITSGSDQSVWSSADEDSATRFIQGQVAGLPVTGLVRVVQRDDDTADSVAGGTTISDSTRYLLEWKSTGTGYELRINDAVESLTVESGADSGDWFGDVGSGGGTNPRDNFVLGALKKNPAATPTQFFQGRIYAVVLTDDTVDRDALLSWFQGEFDVPPAPPPPPPPPFALPWALTITERGSTEVKATFTRGDVVSESDLPPISAEGMDPLNEVGYVPAGLVVPLSSPKADELVANRLLHVWNLDTNEIITSCVLGAPSDKVRPLGAGQTRSVPLYSLPHVLNDSIVVPPGGWNIIPRGDDRHYDWRDPAIGFGGATPHVLGTVSEVNAIPYPTGPDKPYFPNSAQPDITQVITYSEFSSLDSDAPAGTIYSGDDPIIPAGFYKFRGAADNWLEGLWVNGTEIIGFTFGFLDGFETQTFQWDAPATGNMTITAAWTNQPGEGRGPISLALELIDATTGEVVWWTTDAFIGVEFPDHPPGATDGAIGRLNLDESQNTTGFDLHTAALLDVIPTFDQSVDSNGVEWPLQSVSTKSRTKLAAFHLSERGAAAETLMRFVASGDDAGKIAWDYYLIGGRGESKEVSIEVDIDIDRMSIDREEPAATSVAYAAKDRFLIAVTEPGDLPAGQPVIIGVVDLEASGSLDEAARIAADEKADFKRQREKIAITPKAWAGDYWTADSIPVVAVDGDGTTMGLRVQNMHWWIDESGNLRAEPEFGDLFVPVSARPANALARLGPRGVGARSRRATRG